MRFALLAITATALYAQSPEIRGTVIEQGPGTGLAGAEVTLTSFVQGQDTLDARVLATTFTDTRGNFSFKPEKLGEYRVEAKKPGYSMPRGSDRGIFVILTTFRPTQELRFNLMNPGGLTGRFVDEQDQPIAGLHILVQTMQGPGITVAQVQTRPEGTFTAESIPPGRYQVRAQSSLQTLPKIIDYTEEASQLTDHDYEDLIWPTGVSDPRDALPLVIPPGTTANLGTVRLRQVERYRVHLNIQGDCSGNTWKFALLGSTAQPLNCKRDLLLTNVSPGSYQFALWNDEDPIRWALVPLTVTRGNTALNLTVAPAIDVPGRIVTTEGVNPPPTDSLLLSMRPEPNSLMDSQAPQINPDGTFVARSLRWTRYRIFATRVPAPYYVREIRYAGQPARTGRIDLIPGAPLEIELDDRPARITGTLTIGDQPGTFPSIIVLARMPYQPTATLEANAPYSYLVPANNGRFDLIALPPGEYRIAAVSMVAALSAATQVEQALQAGEKITLERGEQRTVQLNLPK